MERTQKTKYQIPQTIPFLGGRPDRDTAIGQEDFLNLQIALNTASSLDELFFLT